MVKKELPANKLVDEFMNQQLITLNKLKEEKEKKEEEQDG